MNELDVVIGVLLAIAVIVWIIVRVNSQTTKKDIKEREKRNRDEAYRFFVDIEQEKKLPVTEVDVVLKDGEVGVFQEPSVLLETRAYRVYGGAGTRIGRIYVGGGASESHQRLREIDSGILVLTNKRSIFDGGHESRSVNLQDIISAKAWSDAIEISSSRRQKSQIYTVKNPILWAEMIQMLASGKLEVAANRTLTESLSPPQNDAEGAETLDDKNQPADESRIDLDQQQTQPAPLVSAVQTGSSKQSEVGSLTGTLAKGTARSVGNRVGREIARGVLGSILGSSRRKRLW
jgi:Bacterial protein of unknown function (DUF853)